MAIESASWRATEPVRRLIRLATGRPEPKPFAPAKVKAIMVIAAAGNTNDVHVGGDANGLAGLFGNVNDLIVVKPGGAFLWAAPSGGLTVTAGTGDILQVANSSSGSSVTYSIVIIGASA